MGMSNGCYRDAGIKADKGRCACRGWMMMGGTYFLYGSRLGSNGLVIGRCGLWMLVLITEWSMRGLGWEGGEQSMFWAGFHLPDHEMQCCQDDYLTVAVGSEC